MTNLPPTDPDVGIFQNDDSTVISAYLQYSEADTIQAIPISPERLLQPESSYSQIPQQKSPQPPPPPPKTTLTGQEQHLASTNERLTDPQNFADVSSDLSWLGPLIVDDGTRSANDISDPASATSSPKISAQTLLPSEPPTPEPANQNNNNNNISPPISSTPQPAVDVALSNTNSSHQPRKLSPGLAARLKALGLGSSKKASQATIAAERVGRLPEEQLRQLDEYHQQRSIATVVERRGRPWKGVVVRIPSRTSLKSAKSNKDAITPEDNIQIPTIQIVDSPETEDRSAFLSDFEAPQVLDMDTNKYRLPDHTNGNGTKVTLDTRKEHIERDARPPSPPEDSPPPVPAKDTPPLSAHQFNPDEYYNPLGLQRPGSIYTISRASFANQLAQLTSLQLPDADSLAGKVAAIPTAQAAVKALIGAAEQIRSWIYKASEVISGLDSDDDVEWSAAGGREGLEEVETATHRFEGLINVYVTAIEELQNRVDIAIVSTDDLTKAVTQMESIMLEWTNIRSTLRSVRGQVEIAMEWEELWNVVLGDIQNELDELSRLVFEMEEKRHKSAMAIASGDAVDMNDLQTIAEETPAGRRRGHSANNRSSVPGLPASPGSPTPTGPAITADDSSLLALFARMQPLRASLDFLPMRLSVFQARAEKAFPTACEELEERRENLDASYKKLEKDAEGLRKELGEDRWVLVFRGAARQAQKMTESVERSVTRLREAVDAGMHLTNQPQFLKKIESYEAKKTHYGPAIDRVLLIIDRGVKDRLTVNGEILRLSAEMQARWEDIKAQMKEMDLVMDELHTDKKGTRLRDSISSMLSNDLFSTMGSGVETPQSSPPSSVIMSGLGIDTRSPASKSTVATRARRSSSGVSSAMQQAQRRPSANNSPKSIPRKPVPRLSTYGPSTPSRDGAATSFANRMAAAGSIPRPSSTLPYRPKWNGSTNTSTLDTGHNFKPLSLSNPSPFAKSKNASTPVRSHSSLAAPIGSRLPTRSPLRAASPSPGPESPPRPVSKLNLLSGPVTGRRTTLLPPQTHKEMASVPPRPASSLATTSRRTSMLPMPRFRKEESAPLARGTSPFPGTGGSRFGLSRSNSRGNSSSLADRYKDNKPRWRH